MGNTLKIFTSHGLSNLKTEVKTKEETVIVPVKVKSKVVFLFNIPVEALKLINHQERINNSQELLNSLPKYC